MSAVLVLAGVTATAFVSTNVDAFVLLVANVARAPGSRRAATAGFLAATALVAASAWAFASASRVLPPGKLGLVGLIPVGMGLRELVIVLRRDAARARPAAASGAPVAGPTARDVVHFREALLLHLSLSLDNFAVYTALLADTLPHLRPLVIATTVAMAFGWAELARATARVPGLSPLMLRWGHGLMAALLIAVGLYILADTETDVLVPAPSVVHVIASPG